MAHMILGLLAESFIHPGMGSNEGAIDLPVTREAATDYPFIPGSGMKGALRDYAHNNGLPREDPVHLECFGKHDNAGCLLVADARLLLLPVRSLSSSYKWVTCPHLVERFVRDQRRTGLKTPDPDGLTVSPGDGLVWGKGEGALFLEERSFSFAGPLPEGLVDVMKPLISHHSTRSRLVDQLIVLSDNDFTWFARYGLAIQTRNVLDVETKESKNLWTEESLPPDTVMYCLLGERNDTPVLPQLQLLMEEKPYLQIGGNETVGQGWLAMADATAGGGYES